MRGRGEIALALVAVSGLLVYGIVLALQGIDGAVGMAVAGAIAAVATGTGVHTYMKRHAET